MSSDQSPGNMTELEKMYADFRAGKFGPSKREPKKQLGHFVTLPRKGKNAKVQMVEMVFDLVDRDGNKLLYRADCPRCKTGKIEVETRFNGRCTVWDETIGLPELCEGCEAEPVPLVKRKAKPQALTDEW